MSEHLPKYTPTHQSVHDGSPVMYLGPDVKSTGSVERGIYMNENGDLFSDRLAQWVPTRTTPEQVIDSIAITLADYNSESIGKSRALFVIEQTLREFITQEAARPMTVHYEG